MLTTGSPSGRPSCNSSKPSETDRLRVAGWPGPVFALDFTGHGDATVPVGGGYTAEQMLADADTALQHIGEATVVGRGLGAYVALLLAGGRPKQVRGAILCDGPGFEGGGGEPRGPEPPPPRLVVRRLIDRIVGSATE